ncbi:unnamed protein product [Durusdinium trenchii]|uniref:Uncharacterized protein n=2 Tax=Durusdinium trenchii TaxID=1381693 RepID=A0ABP0LSL2_9DINO
MATKREEGDSDVDMGTGAAVGSVKQEPTATEVIPKEPAPATANGATTDSSVAPLNQLLEKVPEKVQPENFREILLQVCDALLDHHGGPCQYLQSELGSEPNADWTAFAADLEGLFPRRADLRYLDQLKFPAGSDSPGAIKLSLWQLGWHSDCSSKPPTFKPVARKLLDEFLTHGFLTASDPLILYQSDSYPGRLESWSGFPIFFSHYVKGAARATSVLMLAHVLCKLKVDVASMAPRLFQSLLVIHCTETTCATDATSIALENALKLKHLWCACTTLHSSISQMLEFNGTYCAQCKFLHQKNPQGAGL